MVALAVAGLFAVVMFGALPGFIAERRKHSASTAITLCGLFGLAFWPAWIIALIWAYSQDNRRPAQAQSYRPVAQRPDFDSVEFELRSRERQAKAEQLPDIDWQSEVKR